MKYTRLESHSLPEIAGDSVLYCDPLDTASIAEALVNLYNSVSFCNELSRKGTENSRRFSWKETAAAYRALYVRLLNSLPA